MGRLLYIVGILAAAWVIFDVWGNRRDLNTSSKVLWTISAILFSIITAIVYALTSRK